MDALSGKSKKGRSSGSSIKRVCNRVARGHDGVEVMGMVVLVLVKKDMLFYVQDLRAVRCMGRGFSDHHVVLCKVRLVDAWIKRIEGMNWGKRIRSEN